MQSSKNATTTPLRAGAIFIGSYDDVLQYSNAYYAIESDKSCVIEIYQSNDKHLAGSTEYTYTSGYTSQTIALTHRYVYATVRNDSGDDQTMLNFSMIYK